MNPHLSDSELEILTKIIIQEFPQAEAWIFGSRVLGTERPSSDVDVLLKNSVPLTIEQISSFRLRCSESKLPFFVDPVDWHTSSQDFKNSIASDLYQIR